MAIQNRRGVYTDFDASKMVAGEFAVVQSGDPDSSNGTSLYISFQSGTVKRIILSDDLDGTIGALDDLETTDKTNIVNAINEISEKASIYHGVTSTSGATRDKVVVCSDFELKDGVYIAVDFSQNNTATNARLNVNNTGAKSIVASENSYVTDWIIRGSTYLFRFEDDALGGAYYLIGATERIPSDSTPIMDGTAASGTSKQYARADHVHPTDTSRASTATATTAANGLMSSTDKSKLDEIEAQANKTTIDTTLTNTGQAADAKKVGDELTAVKEDLNELEADLEGETEIQEELSFIKNFYINVGSVTTVDINNPVADPRYKYAIVNCSEGDKFLINAYGGNAPRAYCFVDSSNVKISASDRDVNVINTVVTAPENSAKIIVQDRYIESSDLMSYKITETKGIGDSFVRFDKTQSKTDAEKAVARANIGVEDIDGLSDDIKTALLACFRNVVWHNWEEGGESYYEDLYEALYPDTPIPPEPTPTFNYGVYTPESLINGKYIDGTGAILDGIANKSYYIEDYIPVVRSSYWIGYQPPTKVIDYNGTTIVGVHSESNWRVSEYNENKEFIKQTQFAGNNNNQYSARVVIFDTQTKYIRLGWFDGYSNGDHVFDIENPTTAYTELPMEIGDINASTGQNASNTQRIRTVDYIPVSEATISVIGCPFWSTWSGFAGTSLYAVRCYDENKSYLGNVAAPSPTSDLINGTLPTGTKYVRLIMQYAQISFEHYKYLVGYLIEINGTKYYLVEGE